jgi:Uma2 family endonuclease
MSQHLVESEDSWDIDMSHLVTEDDTPVDNRFSERQQRLLPHTLFCSWEQGKPFEALSNVGLFYALHGTPPVVPDFMLSLGVEPRPVSAEKINRSYMTWVYGKPPDLVIEVVSNKEGEELGRKLEIYAQVRVTYYVVFDPFFMLGERELRAFRLMEGRYLEMVPPTWFPEVGLGLTIWEGDLEGVTARWLRFTDRQGQLLASGHEKAEQAEAKAEQAEAKAEQAAAKAEQAAAELERLRQKLKDLGHDL